MARLVRIPLSIEALAWLLRLPDRCAIVGIDITTKSSSGWGLEFIVVGPDSPDFPEVSKYESPPEAHLSFPHGQSHATITLRDDTKPPPAILAAERPGQIQHIYLDDRVSGLKMVWVSNGSGRWQGIEVHGQPDLNDPDVKALYMIAEHPQAN